MILPPGHGQRARQQYVFRSREKVMIGGVLGAVLIIAVVLVISVATADKKSANGCINVSLPYSTGGAQIYRCGAGARGLCSGVNKPGLTGPAGQIVARACRKAGVAVG
jgi:hypothetical protein